MQIIQSFNQPGQKTFPLLMILFGSKVNPRIQQIRTFNSFIIHLNYWAAVRFFILFMIIFINKSHFQ